MSTHLQYLVVLASCMVITLPLEFILGARVYRQPKRLLFTLLPIGLIFSIFDALSIRWHWWHYAHRYVTNIDLPLHLPIEEGLFFLVIPLCGILTFEAVSHQRHRLSRLRSRDLSLPKHQGPRP